MKILANENIPLEAILALRKEGHDVEWIGQFLCEILKRKINWKGYFAVVTENNVRLLCLPKF